MKTSAPGVSEDQNGIRRFNDAGWQSQIDRAVAALPTGANGAVVAVGTKQEQSLAVVAKLPKGFSVVGTLSHQGTSNWKTWDPTIAIRKTW